MGRFDNRIVTAFDNHRAGFAEVHSCIGEGLCTAYHPSRGRILFEVLCALGMAASCAVAWMQTGASALLGAAAVAALYGLVHLFDMRLPKRAEAVEPQRIEFDAEVERDLPEFQSEPVTPSADDQPPAADQSSEQAEIAEPVTPRTSGNRRPKAPRKRSGRSTSAAKGGECHRVRTARGRLSSLWLPRKSLPFTSHRCSNLRHSSASNERRLAARPADLTSVRKSRSVRPGREGARLGLRLDLGDLRARADIEPVNV